jgi:2'-5' RNA ligase
MRAHDTLAEFGIREVPADELITGFVGLVLQPDAATIRRSYELAASIMPPASEQALVPGALPHLTLTQCALREAPRERVADFVHHLEQRLLARSIPLRTVMPFAAGFVFWCVEPTSPERQMLQREHEDAITLADGFLDPVANAAVVQGTIRLTNDDPALVGNARRYGYAFVRDRYQPHITLGFDPRAAGLETQEHPHAMTVDGVALAKLGPHGRVEYLISL